MNEVTYIQSSERLLMEKLINGGDQPLFPPLNILWRKMCGWAGGVDLNKNTAIEILLQKLVLV